MQLPQFVTNAPSSVYGFVRRRQRAVGVIAGTVGALYLAGKFVLGKMSEMAELARTEGLDREK